MSSLPLAFLISTKLTTHLKLEVVTLKLLSVRYKINGLKKRVFHVN